jgi:hypothetical protein
MDFYQLRRTPVALVSSFSSVSANPSRLNLEMQKARLMFRALITVELKPSVARIQTQARCITFQFPA